MLHNTLLNTVKAKDHCLVYIYKKNNELRTREIPDTSLQRVMCHINIKQFRIVLRCEKDATNIIDYKCICATHDGSTIRLCLTFNE